VQTGIHFQSNHLLSLYKNNSTLINIEETYPKLLSLPLHPNLEAKDVEFVCEVIGEHRN
jgi:dTDP-4-amino-4,6-dideoxygalactose transaminase